MTMVLFFLILSMILISPTLADETVPAKPPAVALSTAVQAALDRVTADEAAIEQASQSFKTLLTKLHADQSAGQEAAIAEDEAAMDTLRTMLHGMRQTLAIDRKQLSKAVTAEIASASIAVDEATARLAQEKKNADPQAIKVAEAELKSAQDCLEAHRQVRWGDASEEEIPAVVTPPPARSPAPQGAGNLQSRVFADRNAVAEGRKNLSLAMDQLRQDEAAGDAAAVAADKARIKAIQDKLRSDEDILRQDMETLKQNTPVSSSWGSAKTTTKTTSSKTATTGTKAGASSAASTGGNASSKLKRGFKSRFNSRLNTKSGINN